MIRLVQNSFLRTYILSIETSLENFQFRLSFWMTMFLENSISIDIKIERIVKYVLQ